MLHLARLTCFAAAPSAAPCGLAARCYAARALPAAARRSADAATEEDMEALGAALFAAAPPAPSLVAIRGDLGTGKSCFTRGAVRALVGDPALRVTSPSYLLDNTYALADGSVVHHMDLHRLAGMGDVEELGLAAALGADVCLVEWPERLGDALPAARLDVAISLASDRQTRNVALEGHGEWWAGVLEVVFPLPGS